MFLQVFHFQKRRMLWGNNTSFQGNYIYNQPILLPKVSTLNAMAAYQFSLNEYSPYKVGLNVSANRQKSDVKINGVFDTRSLFTVSSNATLFSNYLNRAINLDFNVGYNRNVILFETIRQENTFELVSASVGLDGKHFDDQLIWKFYVQQKQSKTNNDEIFYNTINAHLRFKKAKSKIHISIEGNDLLNLASNPFLRTNNTQNYIEEELFLRFPGFITFNIHFRI